MKSISKPDLTLQTVKSIFMQELQLADLPCNETFRELAFSEQQLDKVRNTLQRKFGKSSRALHSDTIFTYTDKLLGL
jgi:hypothetical protein